MSVPPEQVTRVCVVARLRRPGLGDLVQRNILLALIRRAYPRARVTLLVGEELAEEFHEALTCHTYAADLLTCPRAGEADERWPEFLAAWRAQRFQVCAVDPDSTGLHAGHARAAGIPCRIGLPQGRPGDEHLTRPLRLPPPLWGSPDLFEHATGWARALGLPGPLRASEALPDLPRRPGDPPAVDPDRPMIAVHPGGAPHWNRRWPLAHYAELCVRLAKRRSAGLCLLGVGGERAELESLRAAVLGAEPGAVVRVETGASLNRTANLLAAADLLVGNDSSLAHIAAAVRTPSVVVYGPTGTEHLWSRIYPHHRGVSLRWPCQKLRHDLDGLAARRCAEGCVLPYQGPSGPYPRCMTELSVHQVWTAVDLQLAGPAPRRSGARHER